LERDLELRPAIGATQEYFMEDSSRDCEDVCDTLANLPPLNKK
jgi:hypothetical protein